MLVAPLDVESSAFLLPASCLAARHRSVCQPSSRPEPFGEFLPNASYVVAIASSATQELSVSDDLNGAGDVTRTRDLLITNQLLYQLSYAGQARNRYSITEAGSRPLF